MGRRGSARGSEGGSPASPRVSRLHRVSRAPATRRFDGRWLLIVVLAIATLSVFGILSGPLSQPREAHDTWLTRVAPVVRLDQTPPPPPSPAGWVIPPGKETQVRALLAADDGSKLEFEDGVQIDRISIAQNVIEVHVGRGSEPGKLKSSGVLTVHHASQAPVAAPKAEHLAVSFVLNDPGDEATKAALQQVEASVLRRDPADLFSTIEPVAPPEQAPDPIAALRTTRNSISVQLVYVLGLVSLLAGLALASTFRKAGRVEIHTVGRVTHLLPAALQIIIFSYWFAHWPTGRALILPIVTQIFCAYLLDIALSILILRQWTASFGVIPIVLSTHLLAQFELSTWWAGMFSVSVALLAKTTLRREGRPLLNPSVSGLCVIGLIDLFWSGIDTPDYSHAFAAAPNMTELVVLLALIVQFRLRIVLVTLSAALTLLLFSRLTPLASFGVAWAPVTLVLCLLISDPATTPRSPGGRVLFGAFIGTGMVLIQALLTSLGHSDFWSKVLAVPAANYLVPYFDRWGQRLSKLKLLAPEKNKLHVGAWALTASFGLLGKGATLDHSDDQADITSPCYTPAKLGSRCSTNPMFCRPLSVFAEARCWAKR